jgi:hypothetical protein
VKISDLVQWTQGTPNNAGDKIKTIDSTYGFNNLSNFKAVSGITEDDAAKGKLMQGAPTAAYVDGDRVDAIKAVIDEATQGQQAELKALQDALNDQNKGALVDFDKKWIAKLNEAYNNDSFDGTVGPDTPLEDSFKQSIQAAASTAAKEEMVRHQEQVKMIDAHKARRALHGGGRHENLDAISFMSTDNEVDDEEEDDDISLMSTEIGDAAAPMSTAAESEFDVDHFYSELYGKKSLSGGGAYDNDMASVSQLSASDVSLMSTNIESLLSEHSY